MESILRLPRSNATGPETFIAKYFSPKAIHILAQGYLVDEGFCAATRLPWEEIAQKFFSLKGIYKHYVDDHACEYLYGPYRGSPISECSALTGLD